MAHSRDSASSLKKLAWETPRLAKITPERRLVELLLTANGYSADEARLKAARIVHGR